MPEIIRRSELVWKPWKNGGGVATDIVASPRGAGWDSFEWRVSIAKVERAGPFSVFPGTTRGMLILDGRSLTLDIQQAGSPAPTRTRLDRATPAFTFPGDQATFGTPDDGPVTDLNVMIRRDRLQHRMVRWSTHAHSAAWVPVPPGGTVLVHIERGDGCAVLPACPHAAHAGDTIVSTEPICLSGLGAADIIEISIWPL